MSNFKAVDSLTLADLMALEGNTFSIESLDPMNPSWGLLAEFECNPISNKEIIFYGHSLKEKTKTKTKTRGAIILVPSVEAQKCSPYGYPPFCRPHLTLWKLWGFHPEVVGVKKGFISFKEMRGGLSYRSYIDFKMIG